MTPQGSPQSTRPTLASSSSSSSSSSSTFSYPVSSIGSRGVTENDQIFDCTICLEKNLPERSGIVLSKCNHLFCK
jgi:hypothetical protein